MLVMVVIRKRSEMEAKDGGLRSEDQGVTHSPVLKLATVKNWLSRNHTLTEAASANDNAKAERLRKSIPSRSTHMPA